MVDTQFSFDIVIRNITIEKLDGGGSLQIFPNPVELDEADPLFTNLVFGSSIYDPGMTGVLKFKEPGKVGDTFNFSGNEKVIIQVENPHIPDSNKRVELCVENVIRLGDPAGEFLGGKTRRPDEGWQLELISCESYILNRQGWTVEELSGQELIKPPVFLKIATNEDEEWGIPIFKFNSEGEVTETVTEEPKGLINQIAEEYFNGTFFYNTKDADYTINLTESTQEMEIEGTSNVVWIRKNNNLYPWGKDVGNQTLLQLINNLTENSVTAEDYNDKKGFNYLFYRDIDRWNYKSVNKIIKDAEEDEDLIRNYTISDVDIDNEEWEYGDPRLLSLVDFNDWNHLGFWEGGAYSSYYELIKPYYDDPYFNYLDFSTTHHGPELRYGLKTVVNEDDSENTISSYGQRQIIDWDYQRDTRSRGGEEESEEKTFMGIERYPLLPEYVSTSVYLPDSDGNPTTSLVNSRKTHATPLYGYFSSPYNDYRNVPYSYMSSSYTDGKYGKTNDIMWQTMYDITPLKGKIKYTIEKNVKEPLKQNYKNYVDKRNLKEKWNVYKHSICCVQSEEEKYEFLAVITDAKLVQDNDRGGIFEYSWKEVEMWPTHGITGDCQLEEPSGDPTDDELPKCLDGQNPYEKLIDEETYPDAPMQIIVIPGGLSGTYREDPPDDEDPDPNAPPFIQEWTDPAFNINELFNSDDANDIFVGPGINVADGDFNDYPEGFQVMPVGGYFRIEDPKPCDFGEDTGREDRADVYYHNHLVKMYKIPGEILETIKPSPRFEINEEGVSVEKINIPEHIFYFDVQNAHDGSCGC